MDELTPQRQRIPRYGKRFKIQVYAEPGSGKEEAALLASKLKLVSRTNSHKRITHLKDIVRLMASEFEVAARALTDVRKRDWADEKVKDELATLVATRLMGMAVIAKTHLDDGKPMQATRFHDNSRQESKHLIATAYQRAKGIIFRRVPRAAKVADVHEGVGWADRQRLRTPTGQEPQIIKSPRGLRGSEASLRD